MITAAGLTWQAQVAVNMMCGKTYEQAISEVELDPIIWESLTSVISNEKEASALDCIKAAIDRIQTKKEYDFTGIGKAVTIGCIFETLKNITREYIFNGKKGPYSSMLKSAFKNKTLKDIRLLLALNFKLTNSEIDKIITFIPNQFIDSATGKINIP